MSEQWKNAQHVSNGSRFLIVRLSPAFFSALAYGLVGVLAAGLVWAGLNIVLLCIFQILFPTLGLLPKSVEIRGFLMLSSTVVTYTAGMLLYIVLALRREREILTSNTLQTMNTQPWSEPAQHVLTRVVCSNNVLRVSHLADIMRVENKEIKKNTTAARVLAAKHEEELRVQESATLHAKYCAPVDCPVKP